MFGLHVYTHQLPLSNWYLLKSNKQWMKMGKHPCCTFTWECLAMHSGGCISYRERTIWHAVILPKLGALLCFLSWWGWFLFFTFFFHLSLPLCLTLTFYNQVLLWLALLLKSILILGSLIPTIQTFFSVPYSNRQFYQENFTIGLIGIEQAPSYF